MFETIIPNGTRVAFTTSCIAADGSTTERTDYGTVVETTAPYETAVRPMRTYGVIVDSDDEWNATHPLTIMADQLTVVEESNDVAYYVCDSCAVVLENADDSHIDDTETIDRLEGMGLVVRVGEYDNGGYWDCDGCMETVIGTGHIYS